MTDKNMYAQMKKFVEGFEEVEAAYEKMLPVFAIWSEVDPVLGALLSALHGEMVQLRPHSKELTAALAKFESNQDAGQEVGAALRQFIGQYRRLQRIQEALDREKQQAAQLYPELAASLQSA